MPDDWSKIEDALKEKTMSVQELLLLIEKKYGQKRLVWLKIFSDGSGSIVQSDGTAEGIEVCEFNSVEQLLKNLT